MDEIHAKINDYIADKIDIFIDKNKNNMITGSRDTDLLVWTCLDDDSLRNVVQTNRTCHQLSHNEHFWRNRLLDRFGGRSVECVDKSYRSFYFKLTNYERSHLGDPNVGLAVAVELDDLELVKYYLPLANDWVKRRLNSKPRAIQIRNVFAEDLNVWHAYFFALVKNGDESALKILKKCPNGHFILGAVTAIKHGHVNLCLELLNRGGHFPDPRNYKFLFHYNQVMYYALKNGYEQVKDSLSYVAIDWSEAHLLIAFESGNLADVQRAVKNITSELLKMKPIFKAVELGYIDIVRDLISPETWSVALHSAITHDQYFDEILKYMELYGQAPESKHYTLAIQLDRIKMLDRMIKSDQDTTICIRPACQWGKIEIVKLLMDDGGVTIDDYREGLYLAAKNGKEEYKEGCEEVFNFLYRHPCRKMTDTSRLLGFAAQGGNPNIINQVLCNTPTDKILSVLTPKIKYISLKSLQQALEFIRKRLRLGSDFATALDRFSAVAAKHNLNYMVTYIQKFRETL